MAESEKFAFDFKEVVTELVKKQGIHEGIWALYFDFGITGANIAFTAPGAAEPPSKDKPPTDVTPSAIVSIQKMGIIKADHLSSVSVDAAKVNPRPIRLKKSQ